jgi:NADPH:quinone reductase-like Zn-dependent oxidoreductase
MGLCRPKLTILGMDFAGTIDALGEGVASFQLGERVFGLSPDTYGAHAEYVCVPQAGPIATMPADPSFKEAVLGEGAWYADTYLKRFQLGAGHRILIYGASGAIGTAAVQLAKAYGAEVTAVVATPSLDLAKSLGADHVVDYTAEDFTRIADSFDFVFDAVGKTTFFRCRKLLAPNGVYSATDLGPWWQNLLLAAWSSVTGNNKVVMPMPKSSKALMIDLKACMEAGALRAVIDREYPLDAIRDAYRFVESQQKRGIVVINVAADDRGDSRDSGEREGS